MKTVTRRIISRKQWDKLIDKGMLQLINAGFDDDYVITLRKEAIDNLTPETMGKIEEKDYQLTSILCTRSMYSIYIKEESYDIIVEDDLNPLEEKHGFYIPEWMFEDRQDDLVDLYKRYGKYKEE